MMAASSKFNVREGVALGHNGCKLAYSVFSTEAGKNSLPLLLIGGWTMTKNEWGTEWIKKLSEKRPVICFDNRGVGQSDVPEGVYTIDEMAADCKKICEEVDVKSTAIMGVSLGGMIAQTLFKNDKDLVKAAILGCTTHGGRAATPPPKEFFTIFDNWKTGNQTTMSKNFMKYMVDESFVKENKTRFDELCSEMANSKLTEQGIKGQLNALGRFNSLKWIDQLQEIPTLVIQGKADQVISPKNSESIHEKIPGSTLTLLENTGHFWWQTLNPETMASIVNSHIEKAEI